MVDDGAGGGVEWSAGGRFVARWDSGVEFDASDGIDDGECGRVEWGSDGGVQFCAACWFAERGRGGFEWSAVGWDHESSVDRVTDGSGACVVSGCVGGDQQRSVPGVDDDAGPGVDDSSDWRDRFGYV